MRRTTEMQGRILKDLQLIGVMMKEMGIAPLKMITFVCYAFI